jgi:beta-barrel assembly-enhancing protease
MKRLLCAAVLSLPLGACAVSQQEEVAMGQEAAGQVAQQLPMINDPEVVRYINVLGDSIALLTSRADLDWHFYVVNSSDVNAFALPGGFIYVNRGLIERNDRMNELAGVLGHEIGHVVMRHSVKQMQQAQKANVGVTLACILTRICESQATQAAIQVGGAAVFAKFSRSDEKEADDVGVENVVRAGIHPQGMVTMFQKLLAERQAQGDGAAIGGWFATHPTEQSRIDDIQAQISRIPSTTLSRLTSDSKNFHTFKQRVQSAPAAPQQRATR